MDNQSLGNAPFLVIVGQDSTYLPVIPHMDKCELIPAPNTDSLPGNSLLHFGFSFSHECDELLKVGEEGKQQSYTKTFKAFIDRLYEIYAENKPKYILIKIQTDKHQMGIGRIKAACLFLLQNEAYLG